MHPSNGRGRTAARPVPVRGARHPRVPGGSPARASALTGQLGREVARRTGRGCEVDYVGDETMTVDTTEARFAAWPRRDYDAAVVILGINDAVRLTSPSRCTHRLRSLLGRVRAELPSSSAVLLGDIPPLRSLGGYDNAVGRLAQPRADELNAALRGVADRLDGVHVFAVPPAPRSDTRTVRSAASAYAALAVVIADRLTPALLTQDTGRA